MGVLPTRVRIRLDRVVEIDSAIDIFEVNNRVSVNDDSRRAILAREGRFTGRQYCPRDRLTGFEQFKALALEGWVVDGNACVEKIVIKRQRVSNRHVQATSPGSP